MVRPGQCQIFQLFQLLPGSKNDNLVPLLKNCLGIGNNIGAVLRTINGHKRYPCPAAKLRLDNRFSNERTAGSNIYSSIQISFPRGK